MKITVQIIEHQQHTTNDVGSETTLNAPSPTVETTRKRNMHAKLHIRVQSLTHGLQTKTQTPPTRARSSDG